MSASMRRLALALIVIAACGHGDKNAAPPAPTAPPIAKAPVAPARRLIGNDDVYEGVPEIVATSDHGDITVSLVADGDKARIVQTDRGKTTEISWLPLRGGAQFGLFATKNGFGLVHAMPVADASVGVRVTEYVWSSGEGIYNPAREASAVFDDDSLPDWVPAPVRNHFRKDHAVALANRKPGEAGRLADLANRFAKDDHAVMMGADGRDHALEIMRIGHADGKVQLVDTTDDNRVVATYETDVVDDVRASVGVEPDSRHVIFVAEEEHGHGAGAEYFELDWKHEHLVVVAHTAPQEDP
jgi:hypothetical protein